MSSSEGTSGTSMTSTNASTYSSRTGSFYTESDMTESTANTGSTTEYTGRPRSRPHRRSNTPEKSTSRSRSRSRSTMNSTERRKINFTLLGEPANKYKNPFMNFLYHYHNVNKGGPITKSAKEAGKMWKILSAEEKEKYKKKVAQQEEPDEQQASA